MTLERAQGTPRASEDETRRAVRGAVFGRQPRLLTPPPRPMSDDEVFALLAQINKASAGAKR